LVFVYFCRGLSANTEERPTRAVYQAADSKISILIPGLMRAGGVVGHWISETRGGSSVGEVHDSDLVAVVTRKADRRVRTPFYVSATR
jgi:hypothetical protein